MPVLHERIQTSLPVDEAFAFVADFANAMHWDPGVASSERVDEGPLGVGARYRLGVRMAGRVAPMEYQVASFDPPRQVILNGDGSGVTAVDAIRFHVVPTGTVIDYTADIRLTGVMRVLEPFLGRAFSNIGRNAAEGMRNALARLETERTAVAAQS